MHLQGCNLAPIGAHVPRLCVQPLSVPLSVSAAPPVVALGEATSNSISVRHHVATWLPGLDFDYLSYQNHPMLNVDAAMRLQRDHGTWKVWTWHGKDFLSAQALG